MEQILSCGWDTSKYLIFSDNVFANYIYYSHLFSAVMAFFFGFFVFFQNKKLALTRIILMICLSFGIWAFLDLILWATEKPPVVMFVWSILTYFEIFVYVGALLLIQFFINKKHFSFREYFIIFLSFVPIILFTHTTLNLTGFDLTNCDREALEGPLWHYIYIVEGLFALWLLGIGAKAFFKTKKYIERVQISLITVGTFMFLFMFSFGNVLGSFEFDWDISQFGLFGMPIFIAFLSYMILRFNSFRMKTIGTQILVWAMIFLLFGVLFLREIENVRVVVLVTIIFSIFLGNLLIRSVKKEIKQREELEIVTKDLSIANEKLKGLDKLKTEFLSLAAHQLRSPLSAIKGYTSMLMEGSFGEMNENQKMTIDRIFQSSNHLSQVIEDLLNVSKIEQGGLAFSFAKTDLNELVSEVTTEGKINAEKQKISLSLEQNKSGNYFVTIDKEKIRQVITNLFDNAIKYTPQGGNIKVSLEEKGSSVVLSIKDDGMGVPPEILETLFQKFSRGEGAKMNTGGSGLGLYLAKKIVDGHKGKIWVESEGREKGSTFFVELPKA